MSKVQIALTAPQREFARSNDPHPAIVGGLGSGKTRAGTIRAVLLLIEERGLNIGIFLPTYDLLRLRAMPGVEEDLATIGLPFTVNKSTYTISVEGYGDIIFRSYDRPEKIISFEIAHAILDELDTLSKDKASIVWRKVNERVRQKCNRGNSIAVVTTPDQGINGFIYEKWVKKQQKGYTLTKAPTASNPFLPDGYIEQIRNNYDEKLADLYLNGEFVSLTESKVYHFFSREKHHTDQTLLNTDKYIHIGIDFNIGGCVAVVAIVQGLNIIVVDSFVSHDTYDFINNLQRYNDHSCIIYPDASGGSSRTNATQSDIELIENAGYSVEVGSKNPAVRDRINAVNRLLSHGRFKVNCDVCPDLTHALETQGYDKKGDPEKYTEHPAIDDYSDSLGYLIHGIFPIDAFKPARLDGFF